MCPQRTESCEVIGLQKCRCGLGHGLIQGSGPHGAINLEAQTIQFFLNSVTP